jgi:hypothetical protein
MTLHGISDFFFELVEIALCIFFICMTICMVIGTGALILWVLKVI